MDFKFFIKLLAAVFVIFGLFFAGVIIYPKILLARNATLLESDNSDDRLAAFKYLAHSAGEKGHKVIEDFCRSRSDYGWGKQIGSLRCRIISVPDSKNISDKCIRLIGCEHPIIKIEIANCGDNEILFDGIGEVLIFSPYIQSKKPNLAGASGAAASNCKIGARAQRRGTYSLRVSWVYNHYGEGVYITYFICHAKAQIDNYRQIIPLPQIESNTICFAIISEK